MRSGALFRDGVQTAVDPWQPLVELRDVGVHMSIFFSITSSIATATSGVNGFGLWNPSWKYMNTGFLRSAGVSGAMLGTTTM